MFRHDYGFVKNRTKKLWCIAYIWCCYAFDWVETISFVQYFNCAICVNVTKTLIFTLIKLWCAKLSISKMHYIHMYWYAEGTYKNCHHHYYRIPLQLTTNLPDQFYMLEKKRRKDVSNRMSRRRTLNLSPMRQMQHIFFHSLNRITLVFQCISSNMQ